MGMNNAPAINPNMARGMGGGMAGMGMNNMGMGMGNMMGGMGESSLRITRINLGTNADSRHEHGRHGRHGYGQHGRHGHGRWRYGHGGRRRQGECSSLFIYHPRCIPFSSLVSKVNQANTQGGRQPPTAPRGPAAMRNPGGPSGMAQPMAQSGSGNGSSSGAAAGGSGPQRYSTQGQQRSKPY